MKKIKSPGTLPANAIKPNLTEELREKIELYRDKLWRRTESGKITTPPEAEQLIGELGFCYTLTDFRKKMPSLFIAVCGRRDVYSPKNPQKDPESSLAWLLKDEIIRRGNVYYAKLVKGHATFISREMIPIFNSLWGCSRAGESGVLTKEARIILDILRKEWEMATADLLAESGIRKKADFDKIMEELQRRMKVIATEVVYEPKFTYIWTASETRFSNELKSKLPRDEAMYLLAKRYLQTFAYEQSGELAKRFRLTASEANSAFLRLAKEGFAVKLDNGDYLLQSLL